MNALEQQLQELDQRIQETTQLASDPDFASLAQEELQQLEMQKKALEDAMQAIEHSQHQNTRSSMQQFSNCTIEVRSGAGGEEAKIWGNDLMRMYLRYAEMKKWKIEYLDEGVVKIYGKSAYESLKYESGVHRVQRVPETEAQGRIHTSTASIVVLPEVPKTAVEIKDGDLEWQFTRAGGHGGQNVNKVSSAARLTHIPSGIVVESRRERHQERNRELALELLRAQLWEIEEEKRAQETGELRKVIGRAMRAEKIRTYNYPQNRITDHRIHKSWYNLENILEGNLDDVIAEMHNESNWSEGSSSDTQQDDDE